MMGRPQISASAIVPGPAFVMMVSLAVIHSAMFVTKPHTLTFNPPGKLLHKRAASLTEGAQDMQGEQSNQTLVSQHHNLRKARDCQPHTYDSSARSEPCCGRRLPPPDSLRQPYRPKLARSSRWHPCLLHHLQCFQHPESVPWLILTFSGYELCCL